MTIGASKADVYTDFKGLAELRLNGGANPDETLRAAGRQFEALFIQMMLKSMREATPGDPLLGSNDQKTYQEMFDKQIALTLSGKGSLGLADAMVRQLQQGRPATPDSAASSAAAPLPPRPAAPESVGGVAPLSSAAPAGVGADTASAEESKQFTTPEEFVAAMWPAAQETARKLGVDPRVLIAQAALETGWGRSVTQHSDGQSSHNLFNIKAGNGWDGRSVNVATLEYRDGVAVKERASFRSYESYRHSFADYAQFLQSQPRYREALAHAGDPKQFLSALQDAGYATDPRYADKIAAILRRDLLGSPPADIKAGGEGPIT